MNVFIFVANWLVTNSRLIFVGGVANVFGVMAPRFLHTFPQFDDIRNNIDDLL